MRLSNNATKAEYRQFLDETIELFSIKNDNEDDELSCVILEQLLDIKENVVNRCVLTEWDEINERNTLGGLAIKNFDEDDELGQRIKDVFVGAIEYDEMQ